MNSQDLVNRIIEIVKEASQIMTGRDFVITEKGDVSNIVTSSDIAVQKKLEKELTSLLPGSVFLGEESEIPDTGAEYLWVVDPIDGTANFARDMGLSVISVALLHNFSQYLGVVFNPYRNEVFHAIAGEGAFLNGKSIHVSDRSFRSCMFCSAMSLYDRRFAKPCFEIIERIYNEADDLRRLGSAALELCYLAAGRCDLYFEIRLSCWDYAAATLIVKEAGGFCEVMFNQDIPLKKPAGIIAANTSDNYSHLRSIVYDVVPKALY